MKREISVQNLRFGMFVAELDRPWTETPFMFQGFVLTNEKQIEALKQYCKKVYVDSEKSTVPLDREPKPAGAGAAASSGPSVLASIAQKVVYKERASIDAELPRARKAQAKMQFVLQDALEAVSAGNALDAPRVRDAASSIVASVVRNPDAMLLLAQLKEQGEAMLDRAVGVSLYMISFGRFLQLPRDRLDLLGMLGLLQDVGKVRLPSALLEKKGALSAAEIELCRKHVDHSVTILGETPGLPPELSALAALHHERLDGSGYPKGLKGVEIGLFGSIAGLVDCFDAMMHQRPYGEVLSPSNALNQIYKWRGELFDGPLVEQFIQCIGAFPVGSLVELNSGEIGVVIAQNQVRRLQPRVMVVLDVQGNPLRPQKILDLVKEPMIDPETPYRIKRTLEKGSVPVDPNEFFL